MAARNNFYNNQSPNRYQMFSVIPTLGPSSSSRTNALIYSVATGKMLKRHASSKTNMEFGFVRG